MNRHECILIIGAGSIGERHIRNLWQLGYDNLTVFRQRNLPFRNIADAKVRVITEWGEVIKQRPVVAFICTPTSQHMQQIQNCLKLNMHVFAEKPLSHDLNGMDELKLLIKEKNKILQVAYMMRFHPLIKKLKEFLESKSYGDLISFHTHWGSYLPDWHPWEDYREGYAAKKSYGGGVALTLSHDLDLVNWLVNSNVKEYKKEFTYDALPDIDVECIADYIISYESGVTGSVHLSYVEKVPERHYFFVFENASILINYFADSMEIRTTGGSEMIIASDFDKNVHFIEEIKYFFHAIDKMEAYREFSLSQVDESEILIKMCTP